jgi:hypothetical protein
MLKNTRVHAIIEINISRYYKRLKPTAFQLHVKGGQAWQKLEKPYMNHCLARKLKRTDAKTATTH